MCILIDTGPEVAALDATFLLCSLPGEITSNARQSDENLDAAQRRAEARFLQAASGRQKHIAAALSWSESKLSRFMHGEAQQMTRTEFVQLLAMVDENTRAQQVQISEDEYRMLCALARIGADRFVSGLPKVR